MKKIKSALISVSDKSNLKPLLQILKKNKVKIISSGGTFKTIKKLSMKKNIRISGVGFLSLGTTNDRFATLMREIAENNRGTFIGLPIKGLDLRQYE